MYKNLIYGGNVYSDFLINKDGDILNKTTNSHLKPYIHKSGYLVVSLPLGKRGKVKTIRLHKAVAETFLPNPNNLPIVHHKDEDKLNCTLLNLEWTTAKENTNKHWEHVSATNVLCNNRNLTPENVLFIRNNRDMLSQREMGKMFGCSKTTIRNVLVGTYYQHVS